MFIKTGKLLMNEVYSTVTKWEKYDEIALVSALEKQKKRKSKKHPNKFTNTLFKQRDC